MPNLTNKARDAQIARTAREAEALRANLLKRKQQQRDKQKQDKGSALDPPKAEGLWKPNS